LNVFLPIKPEYAFAIFKGDKKFEFRKAGFGKEVKRVVVYASSPYKRIIGYFEVKQIHQGHPETLWRRFRPFAGIDRENFFSYFESRSSGVSIEVERPVSARRHIEPREIFPQFSIPQSFRYLTEHEFESIVEATDSTAACPDDYCEV